MGNSADRISKSSLSLLKLVHQLLPKGLDTLLPVSVAQPHVQHLHLDISEQLVAYYMVQDLLKGTARKVITKRTSLPASWIS